MSKVAIISAIVTIGACVFGCQHTYTSETQWGPDRTRISEKQTKDDVMTSELRRVLEQSAVQGKGSYKAVNELAAKEAAKMLAEKDVVDQLGQTVLRADTTLLSDDTRNRFQSVLRRSSNNMIQGYRVITNEYDDQTQTATCLIELVNYSVIEEFRRELR